MKIFLALFYFFLVFNPCFSEAQIQLEFVEKTSLKADKFIGVDEFNATYFIRNNTLIKETEDNVFSFNQHQLGEISSVDIRNPLKIVVFYRDFNTVVLLDNTLNFLGEPINFSLQDIGQNIGLVSMALGHQLWLYSVDENRLHLWDYQAKKVTFSSKPLSFLKKTAFQPTRQLSNFNDIYLTDQKGLLKFNKYAQFESSLNFNDFSEIIRVEDNFIYVKNSQLYYQTLTQAPTNLTLRPYVKVKNLFTLHNHLYIFDGESIFTFKIIKN